MAKCNQLTHLPAKGLKHYLHCRPVNTVSVNEGVNAFDFSPTANVIATGGTDNIVRLWHPGILREPTGRLVGHRFTVVDIVINDIDQHVISLSSTAVIRVWDMDTLNLLQVKGPARFSRSINYVDLFSRRRMLP